MPEQQGVGVYPLPSQLFPLITKCPRADYEHTPDRQHLSRPGENTAVMVRETLNDECFKGLNTNGLYLMSLPPQLSALLLMEQRDVV